MTKLKIKVTKDILEKSKNCRTQKGEAPTNCAVALAVRDIFPKARVLLNRLQFDCSMPDVSVDHTYETWNYISHFDRSNALERVKMPEYEFEVEIPESIIEKINIDEIRPLLENHPTLQLC